MILYHFTCPWRFWGDNWKSGFDPETESLSVPRRDLTPSNEQYDWEGCPEQWRVPVVWLTTSTETMLAEEPNIMRLRLTVQLSSTDTKLRPFTKWRGCGGRLMPEVYDKKVRAHWWVYCGIIRAQQIVTATTIMGQRPWWEVVNLGDE
jgi:hypothetical protein